MSTPKDTVSPPAACAPACCAWTPLSPFTHHCSPFSTDWRLVKTTGSLVAFFHLCRHLTGILKAGGEGNRGVGSASVHRQMWWAITIPFSWLIKIPVHAVKTQIWHFVKITWFLATFLCINYSTTTLRAALQSLVQILHNLWNQFAI